jgi:GPH family glycoside/pentoside/hexuronide:cation symporter
VLSAIIAKRYYTLNPFLTKIMGELAQGARRNQQEFENLPVSKELQN